MTGPEIEAFLNPIINIGSPVLFIGLLIWAAKDGLLKGADWGSYLKILDIIPEKKYFGPEETERPEHEGFQSNPDIVGTTAFYAKKQRENK